MEVALPLSRRQTLAGLVSLALVTPAMAQSLNLAELATPGPLGDKILGSDKAPVTIIEYASVTCPHCAVFHTEVYPKLKEKFIDTGKVRFIFREFPTAPPMPRSPASCWHAAPATSISLIDAMMEQQRSWIEKPYEAAAHGAPGGMSQEAFETCLKDRKLAEEIGKSASRAVEKFGVESTPTFFVNGTKIVGAQPLAVFEKAIEAVTKTN
jgi:protein-disulfide isomerase